MSATYFKQLRGEDNVKSLELKGLGEADDHYCWILGVNTSLTSLDLGAESNRMGKAWGRAVADALCTNTTLTSLNIAGNQLGDAGGAAVAEALHGNNFKIKSLDVSLNRLGRNAGRAIAAVLSHEANLTSLNIGSNDLYERDKVHLRGVRE